MSIWNIAEILKFENHCDVHMKNQNVNKQLRLVIQI